MTRPVVVLADVNVDLTVPLPDRSLPKEQRTVHPPSLGGGGTGGNTAAALARLGVPVEYCGSIGDDSFGRWIVDDFRALGVGMRGLVTLPDVYTAQVLALIEPDGERYLVIWPNAGGAHTFLNPDHLDRELITNASWIHTTGICLRPAPLNAAVLAGFEQAHAAGVPTSLDLNLRIELWGLSDDVRRTVEAAVALSDVVFGSGTEELMPLTGTNSVEAAVCALSAGTRTVVARLGADGVLACTPDGTLIRAPGFPVTAVNPIGAGDAFNGGFIAAMVEGKGLAEALRWGNAVGALKIARPGGARDLPDRDEVEALLN